MIKVSVFIQNLNIFIRLNKYFVTSTYHAAKCNCMVGFCKKKKRESIKRVYKNSNFRDLEYKSTTIKKIVYCNKISVLNIDISI